MPIYLISFKKASERALRDLLVTRINVSIMYLLSDMFGALYEITASTSVATQLY